jgi:RNA polymerase sigma-70 factor (ECF subfamily)
MPERCARGDEEDGGVDDRLRQVTRAWALAQPAVAAFLTTVVRDFRDRDDLLQEVAVAVIDSFDTFDQSRPFVPWAIGIARNRVGTWLRTRRRQRMSFDTAAVEQLAEAFATLPADDYRRLDRLAECVGRLDARSRQLCEYRYRDDLKPAAIAPLVGMTANTVAKALQRVRDRLRQCIEREPGLT